MITDPEKTEHCDSAAGRSLGQMIEVWTRLALERQEASVTQVGNMLICWALSPLPFMNVVFVMNDRWQAGLLLDTLRQASDLLKRRPESGLVLVVDEHLDIPDRAALQDTAKTAGLAPSLSLCGMECSEILPVYFEDDQIEIRRIAGFEAIEMISEMNGAAYGIPTEAVKVAFSDSAIIENESIVFAGFQHGILVSVAVTFVADDVIYLALVATKPSAQRKGYGGMTVQKALLEARKIFGLDRFALHSTADGVRVYERLGFSTVAHMHLFEVA